MKYRPLPLSLYSSFSFKLNLADDMWWWKGLFSEYANQKGQINGAGISAGAANFRGHARARTAPARVWSAPPRCAELGWSLKITSFCKTILGISYNIKIDHKIPTSNPYLYRFFALNLKVIIVIKAWCHFLQPLPGCARQGDPLLFSPPPPSSDNDGWPLWM